MTPRQVAEIYFCERDSRGQVVLSSAPDAGLDERALFMKHLYAVGVTDPARQETLYHAHRSQQHS